MRPEGADVAQPGPVAGESRVARLFFEGGVVKAVKFEGKEQELGRNRVDLLVHRLRETADLDIGDIAGTQ
jgi:hypothetical protein